MHVQQLVRFSSQFVNKRQVFSSCSLTDYPHLSFSYCFKRVSCIFSRAFQSRKRFHSKPISCDKKGIIAIITKHRVQLNPLSFYMKSIWLKVIKCHYESIVNVFLIVNGQFMSENLNSYRSTFFCFKSIF